MKPSFFLLFWWLMIPSLKAQFNLNNFLSTAREDIDLSEVNEKLEYLQKNRISSPIINRVEARFRSTNRNLSMEEYALRITPTNPLEIFRNKSLNRAQLQSLNTDYDYTFNKALTSRYLLFLNYVFNRELVSLTETEISIMNDRLKYLESGMGNNLLDIEAYLDTEKKITNRETEKIEYQSRLDKLIYLIRQHYSFDGDIDTGYKNIISLPQILQLMNEIRTYADSTNIHLAKSYSDYEVSRQEYQTDLSENIRNIGYLQAEYDEDRGDDSHDHIGFQFGLRIPIFNPDRADNRMDFLKLIEDEQEIYRNQIWLTEEQLNATINLISSLNKAQLVIDKINQLFPEDYMKTYIHQVENDAGKLLKIREHHLEMEYSKIRLLDEVYVNYIEYLNLHGKLVEWPVLNFLSGYFEQL